MLGINIFNRVMVVFCYENKGYKFLKVYTYLVLSRMDIYFMFELNLIIIFIEIF